LFTLSVASLAVGLQAAVTALAHTGEQANA
jgi:hypothetical protein